MIFCKCDNSSDTHIGNHKNLILFVKWRNQVRYFLPCYISHFTDLSPKSIMLSGPRPDRNLLETCSLASLTLACVRDSVVIVSLRPKSTMLASQKTCSRP